MNIFEAVKLSDLKELRGVIAKNEHAVNTLDASGMPPLFTAALYRNQPAIDLLINHKANVDIFACCYLPDIQTGRKLLIDAPSLAVDAAADGRTPLHFACQKGCFEMTQLLIDHGADVNAEDDDGQTPLAAAAHGGPWKPVGDEQIISLLIKSGADVTFWLAAEIGRVDLVERAIADGADVNAFDAHGFTALYHAAHNGHLDCVRLLIDNNADPGRAATDGQTPLSTAALHLLSQQCDPKICRCLIAAGAFYDIHTAAALNDVARIVELVTADAAVVSETIYGMYATDYAAHCGRYEALKVLLDNGASAHTKDASGHTLQFKCEHLPRLRNLLAAYAT